MKNTFDLFARFPLRNIGDLDQLRKDVKSSPLMHLRLLASALGDDNLKELARGDYRSLVHQRGRDKNPYSQYVIEPRLKQMSELGLLVPEMSESVKKLPLGTFCLQVEFTLSKAYLSRDDDGFYVIDNPLKKEKVFNVPYIAAASWKGNLRWTTMYLRIVLPLENMKRKLLDSQDELKAKIEYNTFCISLAEERLRQTLLFGSEQGWQEDKTDGWTAFLDKLLGDSAAKKYRASLKAHFRVTEDKSVPHSEGRLQFFSTYLDKIDLEVINPRDRKTRTGKQPIYFEISPAGAKGVFTLLYFPFDLLGDEIDLRTLAQNDMQIIIEGIHGMLCDYGFSAKKSSGFGVADSNALSGRLQVNDPGWEKRRSEWQGFEELKRLIQGWQEVRR